MMVYNCNSKDIINISIIGEKAYNLKRCKDTNIPIPQWMVISSEAFSQHISESFLERSQDEIRAYIKNCNLNT